mmetsp:Transcript_1594/g.5629  ORF Transcript_1594/g.5629 Transcript_1594/m.5629 type:complete len:214 (+) Transcript_1594:1331-1972(+)
MLPRRHALCLRLRLRCGADVGEGTAAGVGGGRGGPQGLRRGRRVRRILRTVREFADERQGRGGAALAQADLSGGARDEPKVGRDVRVPLLPERPPQHRHLRQVAPRQPGKGLRSRRAQVPPRHPGPRRRGARLVRAAAGEPGSGAGCRAGAQLWPGRQHVQRPAAAANRRQQARLHRAQGARHGGQDHPHQHPHQHPHRHRLQAAVWRRRQRA